MPLLVATVLALRDLVVKVTKKKEEIYQLKLGTKGGRSWKASSMKVKLQRIEKIRQEIIKKLGIDIAIKERWLNGLERKRLCKIDWKEFWGLNMITVTISINGNPIITRSARKISGEDGGTCKYRVDDGITIEHFTPDGPAKLAIKMLKGVKRIWKT